jgi:hypothetical protein
MKFSVTHELINRTLEFLSKKPWVEVAALMNDWQNNKELCAPIIESEAPVSANDPGITSNKKKQ